MPENQQQPQQPAPQRLPLDKLSAILEEIVNTTDPTSELRSGEGSDVEKMWAGLCAVAGGARLAVARLIDVARTAKNRADKLELEVKKLNERLDKLPGQIIEEVIKIASQSQETTQEEIDDEAPAQPAAPASAPAPAAAAAPAPKPPKLATVKPADGAA